MSISNIRRTIPNTMNNGNGSGGGGGGLLNRLGPKVGGGRTGTKILVSNLLTDVTDSEELRELFATVGEVLHAEVRVKWREGGREGGMEEGREEGREEGKEGVAATARNVGQRRLFSCFPLNFRFPLTYLLKNSSNFFVLTLLFLLLRSITDKVWP